MRHVLSLVTLAIVSAATCRAQSLPSRVWHPSGGASPGDIEGALVRQDEKLVVVKTPDGKTVSISRSSLDDEDLRYLRAVAKVSRPYRNWTIGGQSVSASFLRLEGFDSERSKRQAVLVRFDDGKEKGYAVGSLGKDDQAYLAPFLKNPVSPAPKPSSAYQVRWGEYSPSKSPEPFEYHATDHFVFFWGKKIEDDAKQWQDPKFRQMNFEYFERVFRYFEGIGASVPGWNSSIKYKTNVYVTRTGLSKFPEGFAFGGESIIIHPGAMLEGSSVVPHEFGHTMQLASGGYRDSPFVGWFWENHGNFCSGLFIPGTSSALGVYAERCHYELDSSRMNYGSWPILQYIVEHPRFKPSFAFDIWKQAKRDANGAATETPIETMIRLGVEQHQFKGDGIGDFGDLVGQMAAHNATWDYLYQDAYNADLQWLQSNGAPYRGKTMLRPVADRPGWFAPWYSQTPRQFGFNVIDLKPVDGAKQVAVDVSGIVDETLKSDWRCVLVAIGKNGQARYGRMWRTGKAELELRPGESRVALVVAACPNAVVRTEFRPGYNKQKRHFPYEVRLTNCSPGAKPVGTLTHDGIEGAAHPNGGGFVAVSARVDSTAYVGPNAQVLGNALVKGNARIEDYAVVTGDAVVQDQARVGGFALIRDRAQIKGSARVREFAVVHDNVTVTDRARVREFMSVSGNGLVGGDVLVKGFADTYTGTRAPIIGGAILGQDAELHLDNWPKPIEFGTLYGFMADDQLRTDLVDNDYLAASWDMSQPRSSILIDQCTDNDGVLRGGAKFVGNALDLDGSSGYVALEGSVFDASSWTFEAKLNWRGGGAGQAILALGNGKSSVMLTPSNRNGRVSVVVRTPGKEVEFEGKSAVSVGVVTAVKLVVQGNRVTVFLDGRDCGLSGLASVEVGDLNPSFAYLGRDASASGYLNGQILSGKVYRRAK